MRMNIFAKDFSENADKLNVGRSTNIGDTKMLVIKLDTAGQLFDALHQANREFSYDACKAMIEFYDELGEDVEFDPVAISGDWNEMSPENIERAGEEYMKDIRDNTVVYELENGNILYMSF